MDVYDLKEVPGEINVNPLHGRGGARDTSSTLQQSVNKERGGRGEGEGRERGGGRGGGEWGEGGEREKGRGEGRGRGGEG